MEIIADFIVDAFLARKQYPFEMLACNHYFLSVLFEGKIKNSFQLIVITLRDPARTWKYLDRSQRWGDTTAPDLFAASIAS